MRTALTLLTVSFAPLIAGQLLAQRPVRPPLAGPNDSATIPVPPSVLLEVRRLASQIPGIWRDILPQIQAGSSTRNIEARLQTALSARGLTSALRGYRAYPNDVTISVNDEMINTLPSSRQLQRGDVVKLQFGVRTGTRAFAYQAWSFPVGPQPGESASLLASAYAALSAGVAEAKVGRHVGHISNAIAETLSRSGFAASPNFVGHGIGSSLHMLPEVPGTHVAAPAQTPSLTDGTVLSIVVLAHSGSTAAIVLSDGWNVVSKDGRVSMLLSQMVVVRPRAPEILTPPVLPPG